MLEVGAFEAKTHLSALLDKVDGGQEITITKRGRPVARLVPIEAEGPKGVDDVIDQLFAARKGLTLNGLNWKDLRDEGRR